MNQFQHHQPSIGIISSVDKQRERITPTLQPMEHEINSLPCLYDVHEALMEMECLIVPVHGTYAQSVVIPYPMRLPRTGKITSASPIVASFDGKTTECRTLVPISEKDVGKNVLLVPVVNEKDGPMKYIIAGVIQ